MYRHEYEVHTFFRTVSSIQQGFKLARLEQRPFFGFYFLKKGEHNKKSVHRTYLIGEVFTYDQIKALNTTGTYNALLNGMSKNKQQKAIKTISDSWWVMNKNIVVWEK